MAQPAQPIKAPAWIQGTASSPAIAPGQRADTGKGVQFLPAVPVSDASERRSSQSTISTHHSEPPAILAARDAFAGLMQHMSWFDNLQNLRHLCASSATLHSSTAELISALNQDKRRRSAKGSASLKQRLATVQSNLSEVRKDLDAIPDDFHGPDSHVIAPKLLEQRFNAALINIAAMLPSASETYAASSVAHYASEVTSDEESEATAEVRTEEEDTYRDKVGDVRIFFERLVEVEEEFQIELSQREFREDQEQPPETSYETFKLQFDEECLVIARAHEQAYEAAVEAYRVCTAKGLVVQAFRPDGSMVSVAQERAGSPDPELSPGLETSVITPNDLARGQTLEDYQQAQAETANNIRADGSLALSDQKKSDISRWTADIRPEKGHPGKRIAVAVESSPLAIDSQSTQASKRESRDQERGRIELSPFASPSLLWPIDSTRGAGQTESIESNRNPEPAVGSSKLATTPVVASHTQHEPRSSGQRAPLGPQSAGGRAGRAKGAEKSSREAVPAPSKGVKGGAKPV